MQPLSGRVHARNAVVAEDFAVARFTRAFFPAADPKRRVGVVPHMRSSAGARSDKLFAHGLWEV
jgi:hypothetical protein